MRPNEAGSRAQNQLQAPQTPSRKANIKRTAVVEQTCNKTMNEVGSSARVCNGTEPTQVVVAIAAEEVDVMNEGKFLIQCDAKITDHGGEGKVREVGNKAN